MNLFIDTNVFLSFYHLSSDDLAELKKLGVLVRQGMIDLLLPDQVAAEFRRNRANKIADALKRLREQRLSLQFPQLCRDYEEYENLRRYQREYEELFGQLLERIDTDVQAQKLKADVIIQELFGLATNVLASPMIIERARLRFERGNPPGKEGSLGDALNWESLLSVVPLASDLFFISEDKDYCSALDGNVFDPFLLDEWTATKKSHLYFYKRLSGFFKERFPDIQLASEWEKDRLITELANSGNFRQTHSAINKLSRYSDFSVSQVNEIISAVVTNSQINLIINDTDVKEFVSNLIHGREETVDGLNLALLRQYLPKELTGEDLPF